MSETRNRAYKEWIEKGKISKARRKVAAALAVADMTAKQVEQVIPEHDGQTIRPRITELKMIDCVEVVGERTNPSGADAEVVSLTERGYRYVRGEIDPDVPKSVGHHRKKVVEVARGVVAGTVDVDVLEIALERLDRAKEAHDL